MKCFIYRNLNRKGFIYSLKALEGPHKGRVVAYASSVFVSNAKFVVSAKGQARARKQKRRNVHAGIVGMVEGINNHINRLSHTIDQREFARLPRGIPVTYNPWKYDFFVDRNTNTPIFWARIAQIHGPIVEAVF
jgi:hypothetical protein